VLRDKIGRVLIVDDDVDILTAMRLLLKPHVELVHTEPNPSNIPARLKDLNYDAILLDMNFSKDSVSGEEGFHWLENILELDPSAVVIMITAYGDVDTAVRAVKQGAVDFVLKPWQNEKILATINSAMKLSATRGQVRVLQDRQRTLSAELEQSFQDIIGRSQGMLRVFEIIEKVAGTEANVLILGENGTGKELVARAIHRKSKRSQEIFVTVDMGAITESLFESEMFGHKRGAFTDARQDRAGRFEVANTGTLFLDEIGNLSQAMQAKLLRALESRTVTRVGDNRAMNVDIRLICATNHDIGEMAATRVFRQDLLYRINTVEIHLPPLRDRREDIPTLIDHYLQYFAKKYNRGSLTVSQASQRKLERYDWPGNVRELKHAIERAVIMAEDKVLQPSDFFISVADDRSGDVELDSFNLEDVERTVVLKAIRKHDGNISHAAKELGLTRTSLYRRIEKYGL
jgi:two-component system, NtrC family, response regulator HydG